MAYILTRNHAAIMLDGRTVGVGSDHPRWSDIEAALLVGDDQLALELADVETQVAKAIDGTKLTILAGQVLYNGNPVFGAAVDALLDTIRRAEECGVVPYVDALARFIERAELNPSMRARRDLFAFLEAGGFTILPDGRFAAYKKVRRLPSGKLVDIHSGKFDNSVGSKPTVPRRDVDDDPTATCSYGLHVCSQSYLPYFGSGASDTVVYVAVDPADVVAIPVDYNNAKMRVSSYEVLGERPDLHDQSERDMPLGLWRLWSDTSDDDDPSGEDDDWI